MVHDCASIHSAPSSKDLGKKKRANRNAKLKQCKLDARREQWLSQGKNWGGKGEKRNETGDLGVEPVHKRNGNNHSLENLGARRTGGSEVDGSIHHNHHDSESESPANSPTVMIGTDAGTNYAGSFSGGSSSSSSSSGSSGGCWSGSITEEEEEGDDDDDGCLDDWEAMADALAADDKQKAPCSDPPVEHEHVAKINFSGDSDIGLGVGVVDSKPECVRTAPGGNAQAWRPDDACRPQSLPNLTKHLSFSNPKWHFRGGIAWAHSVPSSCPICYEDLDLTDTSFLPCLCGFRLCLFCHKRILEEDARCPGCRKPYEQNPVEAEANVGGGSLTFRLSRTCSMITRS